jgi:hypothetical protein
VKFWRSILILSCFSILFFAPTTGFAQSNNVPNCSDTNYNTFPCKDASGNTINSNPCDLVAPGDRNGTDTSCNPDGTYKPATGDAIKIDICAQLGIVAKALMLLPCAVADFISRLLISITGGIMYGGGALLDFSVDKFILNISSMFKDSDGKDVAYIYNAWSAIRDLANIAAFFAAVYAGFLRIIGQNQEDFRKAVAKLLIFALLTNFSFAISKFAIDIANVVSLQIYGATTGYKFSGNTSSSGVGTIIKDYGVSTAYMKMMNLSAFVVDSGKITPESGFKVDSLTTAITSIIFFIVAGWMFIKLAIFIIVRTFMLMVSVIFSPAMFIGGLVDPLTKVHDKWRETFFGNLIVAPLVMIFIWLSLQILGASAQMLSSTNTTELTKTLTNVSLLIVGAASLHLAVKFAEQASGAVGQFAVKVLGGVVGGVAAAAATGGASFVARAGAARAAAMAGNVGKKWATAEGAGGVKKFTGGLLLKGGDRLEKAEIFGKSAYSVRKAAEDKVADKRNTVLRENRVAARNLGWSDRLEQAKSADEVAFIQSKIQSGAKYDKDTHEAEISNLKNKPIQRTTAKDLRVLDKDLAKAKELDEKIKARDADVQAKIDSEQKALDEEYGDIIKTRTEYLENQKKGGASQEELQKTLDYIDNTKKTLAEKKSEVVKRLTDEKDSAIDYSEWKTSLDNLQKEYNKTTVAYKAGEMIKEMREQDKADLETIKNIPVKAAEAFNKATGGAFVTEFDKNTQNNNGGITPPSGAPLESLTEDNAKQIENRISRAASLRSKK